MEKKKDSDTNDIILQEKEGPVYDKEIIFTPLGQRPVGRIRAYPCQVEGGEEVHLYFLIDAYGNILSGGQDRLGIENVDTHAYMPQLLVTAIQKWREDELAQARAIGHPGKDKVQSKAKTDKEGHER